MFRHIYGGCQTRRYVVREGYGLMVTQDGDYEVDAKEERRIYKIWGLVRPTAGRSLSCPTTLSRQNIRGDFHEETQADKIQFARLSFQRFRSSAVRTGIARDSRDCSSLHWAWGACQHPDQMPDRHSDHRQSTDVVRHQLCQSRPRGVLSGGPLDQGRRYHRHSPPEIRANCRHR